MIHYRGSHYRNYWLMYAQLGDFGVSSPKVCMRREPSVALMHEMHGLGLPGRFLPGRGMLAGPP